MLKRIILFLFFSIYTVLVGHGRNLGGSAFVSNIRYYGNQQNYVWSIAQTGQGTMLIAGKTGLYEYDSESWTLIETPDAPLTIITDKKNDKVYISGRNYIGYLNQGENKEYTFEYVKSNINFYGNFTHCVEDESHIFFCSPYQLVCVSKENSRAIYSHEYLENPFLGLFSFQNKLYLGIQDEGTFLIDSSGLLSVSLQHINNQTVVFTAKFSNELNLLGTENGNLFLFNGQKLEPFYIDDSEFLQSGILSDGVLIDSHRLALSTKNFGILIVDKQTGKTLNTINYQSGLPNDFVTSLFVDKQAGLWIAHPIGLSRIDTRLPLYSYSSHPGLSSGIISLEYWQQKLYVATTTGVFVLDTINRYDTKELVKRIPLKQEVRSKTPVKARQKETHDRGGTPRKISGGRIADADDEKDKPKKGFLSRLFSKNEHKEEVLTDGKPLKGSPKAKGAAPKEVPLQRYEVFRYEQYILKAKDYGFSKISGIGRRCKLLLPFDEKLLAITDTKIYSINTEKEAVEIFNNIHIYSVIKSSFDPAVIYLVAEGGIFIGRYKNDLWEFEQILMNNTSLNATGIEELNSNTLILALPNSLLEYSLTEGTQIRTRVFNPYSERILLKKVDGELYAVIGNSLYKVEDSKTERLKLSKEDGLTIVNTINNQPNQLWLDCDNKTYRHFGGTDIPKKLFPFLRIFDNINAIYLDNQKNLWLVENFERIYQIDVKAFENYHVDVEVLIKQILSPKSGISIYQGQKLKYAENALDFTVVSPSYFMYKSNQYQYLIEGLMGEWSEWSTEQLISVPYLPPGNYTFKVRARNIFGTESGIKSFAFSITPPFWKTPYFYVGIILIVAIALYLLQKYRMKKYLQEKKILQIKVEERTSELELKNKAITDSIVYAERIQKGILPAGDLINSCLGDNFILYMPRNIVSGDFYWLAQKEHLTFVVAADCTGHGVPGAFMSMLGIAYLNEIVRKSQPDITAAEILEKLRERIVKLFSQETFKTNDGMDMALLVINAENKEMQYSGAYNPLYQVTPSDNPKVDKENITAEQNGFSLLVYKADRFHVGKAARGYKEFTNHIIKYRPEDTFYIFSDGYVDQFGGDEETKFKFGPFKRLILDIHAKPLGTQKATLVKTFNDWKRDFEQTDDVLIWGFRVKDN